MPWWEDGPDTSHEDRLEEQAILENAPDSWLGLRIRLRRAIDDGQWEEAHRLAALVDAA